MIIKKVIVILEAIKEKPRTAKELRDVGICSLQLSYRYLQCLSRNDYFIKKTYHFPSGRIERPATTYKMKLDGYALLKYLKQIEGVK